MRVHIVGDITSEYCERNIVLFRKKTLQLYQEMFLLQILVGLNTLWRYGWVKLILLVVVVVVPERGEVYCSGSCNSSINTSSSCD